MENVENMEYNTTRNRLVIREYGRHIQKMVEYVLTLEDREKRQKNAYALIELMGFLNPHLKNVEDFRHKLWDHLFLISDFKLDVDSPYPIPTRETLKAKPEQLSYSNRTCFYYKRRAGIQQPAFCKTPCRQYPGRIWQRG